MLFRSRLNDLGDSEGSNAEWLEVLKSNSNNEMAYIGLGKTMEEQLAGWDFIRVSKSVIVNFGQVKSLRPDFGGRLRLTMSSGEVVVANRQYVPAIKAKLGL